MARERALGIFCVEGDWSPKLTARASVRELLEILHDVAGIDFIHHHVESADGLFDVLRRWGQKQYAHYALGYFAFHGEPGSILVGQQSVTLGQLGGALSGRASQKILYFGSCSVLRAPRRELDAFCTITGSPCIVGFTRNVDWIASAALDLILLQAIAIRRTRMPFDAGWSGSSGTSRPIWDSGCRARGASRGRRRGQLRADRRRDAVGALPAASPPTLKRRSTTAWRRPA